MYLSDDAPLTSDNNSSSSPAVSLTHSLCPSNSLSSSSVSSSFQNANKEDMDTYSNDAGDHVIMGSLHQGEHPFSSDLAAGFQCTSMAYTSILYSSLTNICSWSADDVNNVMFQDHTLHTNQLIHLGRNVHRADHRLAIDELPTKPTILVGKKHFSCNANLSITKFLLFLNFEAEFSTTLQQFDQANGFLIRFGDYKTAVVKQEHHFHR